MHLKPPKEWLKLSRTKSDQNFQAPGKHLDQACTSRTCPWNPKSSSESWAMHVPMDHSCPHRADHDAPTWSYFKHLKTSSCSYKFLATYGTGSYFLSLAEKPTIPLCTLSWQCYGWVARLRTAQIQLINGLYWYYWMWLCGLSKISTRSKLLRSNIDWETDYSRTLGLKIIRLG